MNKYEEFAVWLKGFKVIYASMRTPNSDEWDVIKAKLDMVFLPEAQQLPPAKEVFSHFPQRSIHGDTMRRKLAEGRAANGDMNSFDATQMSGIGREEYAGEPKNWKSDPDAGRKAGEAARSLAAAASQVLETNPTVPAPLETGKKNLRDELQQVAQFSGEDTETRFVEQGPLL
jgi:hypothetical protein